MYIKTVTIENVRSFSKLKWSISEEQAAGWHVILGDNGAGKSSFVRAVALALVGPTEAYALRQNWSQWLKANEKLGEIKLNLLRHENTDQIMPADIYSYPPGPLYSKSEKTPLAKSAEKEFPSVYISFKKDWDGTWLLYLPGNGTPDYDRWGYIWGNAEGWFSASFGPFRRFSGGDQEEEKIFRTNPKLARHLTAFGENVALTETLVWLKDLRFKQLEEKPEGELLQKVKDFVNQADFLPNCVRLEKVTSDFVEFVDGNGYPVAVEELSDGYRSMLSLTFELIRQLAAAYGQDKIFSEDRTQIVVPGVVLIDEVDAHLHPTWQREVGVWFKQHFPQMQFIVTTHSPLVCQAATTIYKLPDPGSDEEGTMITGTDFDRLRYGNILDAYSTEAFGIVTRSEEAKKFLDRLAELNRRELHKGLTAKEKQEQEQLRAAMPTTAHTTG